MTVTPPTLTPPTAPPAAPPPAPGRRWPRLWSRLLWAAALAAVAGFIWSVGPAALLAALAELSAGEIIILLAVNGAILVLLALRWWLILRGLDRPVGLTALVGYRLAAFGLSYFTPGPQFGGEPLQVYLLRRRHAIPGSSAVAAVTLDKTFELLFNFTFLLLGVFVIIGEGIWPEINGPGLLWLPLALLALPLALIVVGLTGRRPTSWLLAALARRAAPGLAGSVRFTRISRVVSSVETDLTRFLRQVSWQTGLIAALSALNWVALAGEYGLMLTFLGVDVTLARLLIALTAARLAFLLPAPGGLGALEASQLLVFQALGLDPAAGLAVSLVIRGRDVLAGALGLWWAGRLTR